MRRGQIIGLLGLTIASAASASVVALRKQIFTKALKLPPAGNGVDIRRGLRMPMPDGVHLVADLYRPKTDEPLPTILIRTPYSRGGSSAYMLTFLCQRMAERGYNVVTQDTRGRFESEGEYEPYLTEMEDGAATADWIVAQPWSDGAIGTWGPSYLGYTQWALAASGSPHVKALYPIVTHTNIGGRPEHSFGLDLLSRWVLLLDSMGNEELSRLERLQRTLIVSHQDKHLAPAFTHLPLVELDEQIFGKKLDFFKSWFEHSQEEGYFERIDLADSVASAPPAHFVAGWQDIFLSEQLADFGRQQAAGKQPYLTIGPWTHVSPQSQFKLDEAIAWFDAHLKGQRGKLRPNPVSIYVMEADSWRAFDEWPVPHTPHTLFLSGSGNYHAGKLTEVPPVGTQLPDHYHYDPAKPTPSFGGPSLGGSPPQVDNRALEARADVLTYTTEPLTADLELIGVPRLTLYVETTAVSSDFFGRICVVKPNGMSLNITDAIYTLSPERGERLDNGIVRVSFDLRPTAYLLKAGERIRLQVSSGAHPRYARNLGLNEDMFTATEMVSADIKVHHDATYPASLVIPIAN